MKALSLTVVVIVLALQVTPDRALPDPSSIDASETFVCRGVLEDRAVVAPLAGREAVDLGWLYLQLEPTVSAEDSVYIQETAELLLPSLVAVLGLPPAGVDTLRISIFPGGGSTSHSGRFMTMPTIRHARGVDDDHDGRIDEDPADGFDNDGDGRVDEDLTYHRAWDSIFLHEMGHVFHGGVPIPSWTAEGFAEAVQYMVAEHVAAHTDRDLRQVPSVSLATDDVLNRNSFQILGGSGQMSRRVDPGWAYRAAEVTFVLPCLAEIAAGRTKPHPLARFKKELFDQLQYESEPSIFSAMDAAWSTPVDGVFPPSRWVRARSVVNPWVRTASFLDIAPGYPQTALNPGRLVLKIVHQYDYAAEVEQPVSTAITYLDADGNAREVLDSPYTPELAPGAYELLATATTGEGELLTATTWILVTSSGEPIYDGGEGIALIFIDGSGAPVDIGDLQVNGRILERVPGGAIVAPYSGLQPDDALTVHDGDRPLGTVTVPGPFSRVVPIRVEGSRMGGAVSWSPYRVYPGASLSVTIRKDQTAIPPEAAAIDAVLCDGGRDLARVPMRETGISDEWTAVLPVPQITASPMIRFESDAGDHGDCQNPFGYWSLVTSLPLAQTPSAALASVERAGDRLILTFEDAGVPSGLQIQTSSAPDGPWKTSAEPPVPSPLDEHVLVWQIPEDPGSRRYLRVTAVVGGERVVLFTDVLGRKRPRWPLRLVGVHPNPSPHEVAWNLEVDQPLPVVFEVFDLQGRRVHGPEDILLQPGSREIRWLGFREGKVGAGVYFLSLTTGGNRAVARAVLVRD